jgi:hypothetical protein
MCLKFTYKIFMLITYMNKIIEKLKLGNEFTKLPPKQKIFNSVKRNTPPIANYNFEADVLYLPETKEKNKYLLVCCDLANDKFDIEPMQKKDSNSTLSALKTMFKRKNIKLPKVSIKTDNGTEFKDEFTKFLDTNNIFHSVSLPYRHKQLANVESLNKQLGLLFNLYMNSKEIETGEEYYEWTDIIKLVRKELNKEREKKMPKYKDWIDTIVYPNVITAGKPLFKIGDIVHQKLEIPKNALNNNQPTTKFRAGDFRYSVVPKKIIKIITMMDKPYYRYMLEGWPNVSYSDDELIKAKKEEKETKWEVERFINKKIVNKKVYYEVKWKGYKMTENTIEPENKLIADLGKVHFEKLLSLMK